MTGKRVDTKPHQFLPGEYNKHDGIWYARCPGGPADSMLANLSKHQVTEHEDGTITVSPSILVTGGPPDKRHQWHGFLERGIWREC